MEALEIRTESRDEIQLILLDVMMPVMNGYEACRKIREDYEQIDLPILLLTARNQPKDLIEGLYGFTMQIYQMENKPLVPKRWIVERTFGWFQWERRLNWDYERYTKSDETIIYLASIRNAKAVNLNSLTGS